jgi:hypothetical protein
MLPAINTESTKSFVGLKCMETTSPRMLLTPYPPPYPGMFANDAKKAKKGDQVYDSFIHWNKVQLNKCKYLNNWYLHIPKIVY